MNRVFEDTACRGRQLSHSQYLSGAPLNAGCGPHRSGVAEVAAGRSPCWGVAQHFARHAHHHLGPRPRETGLAAAFPFTAPPDTSSVWEGRVPGCRAEVDQYGAFGTAWVCGRAGLGPSRARGGWARGPGTAPGVASDDRRRPDVVIYGAAARGEALCCDATLVSPIRRDGNPVDGAPARDGVALATARRRKLARCPELVQSGPHRLCILAAEVGGRWCAVSQTLGQPSSLSVPSGPLPCRATQLRRDGHGAGGAPWWSLCSAPCAARCWAFGPCCFCPARRRRVCCCFGRCLPLPVGYALGPAVNGCKNLVDPWCWCITLCW